MSDRIPVCNDPDGNLLFDEPIGSCNYCTLQHLKKYETNNPLGKEQKMLELRPEGNWINVYVVTKDQYGQTNGEQWKASFMALTTRCAC